MLVLNQDGRKDKLRLTQLTQKCIFEGNTFEATILQCFFPHICPIFDETDLNRKRLQFTTFLQFPWFTLGTCSKNHHQAGLVASHTSS